MSQQLHALCPCSSRTAQPPRACPNRRHRCLLPVRAALGLNQPGNPPPPDLRLSRRQLSVGSTALPLLLLADAHSAKAADTDGGDAAQPADNTCGADGGSESITQRAFMDVSINGEPAGRIVVGLYGQSAPKGSARFASLISGAPGTSYRRKEFIKIMPGYVQHGGVRSYGPEAAEELVAEWEATAGGAAGCGGTVKAAAGSVGIVVRDPNKPPPKIKLVARKGRLEVDEEEIVPLPNGTEFVIATKDVPELKASTLVVGKVIEGMDVVEKIAGVKTVQENTSSPYFRVAKLIGDKRAVVAERGFNRPYSKIVVTNCGVIG